ncbi:MAG: ornithine cyclodeaminase [Actinomycetota bacterium]|jgi:ornithine cyclodeaminase|nr:MAG: ornithine cyclodeaminase [Actinomycetota bacterium]
MRWIDAEELARRVPIAAAIEALERAFGTAGATAPLRTSVSTPAGTLLLMPAAGSGGVGVKLVTLTPDNPARGRPLVQAVYALFDPTTQEPRALVDGTALTALRTSAVSALATRLLARPDAERLVLFGAGVQATAHLASMCAVRPIREVVVVSRGSQRARELVERARDRGLRARPGTAHDVAEADIVCTCTTARTPLFDGRLLPPGSHVNAIGAYEPDAREVDTETVRRARVVVETREVAMAEAGDLALAVAEGAIGWDHVVADLGELVRGAVVRQGPEDRTLFVSVGLAVEDLAVAAAAVE